MWPDTKYYKLKNQSGVIFFEIIGSTCYGGRFVLVIIQLFEFFMFR